MAYIACTENLLAEFDETPDRLVGTVSSAHPLQHWHGGIYRFQQRKSVVLINDASRFALFLPGLRREHFIDFEKVFRERLRQELLRLRLSRPQVAQALLMLGPLSFGPAMMAEVHETMTCVALDIKAFVNRIGHLPMEDSEREEIMDGINATPLTLGTEQERNILVPAQAMKSLVAG